MIESIGAFLGALFTSWLGAGLVIIVGISVSLWGGSAVTTRVLERVQPRARLQHMLAVEATDDTATTSQGGHGQGERSGGGTPDDAPEVDLAAREAITMQLLEGLRGGAWIGYLERLAVTGAIALGYPEGIAGVIAIKAFARYPELKGNEARNAAQPQRQGLLAERFIIGTMTSMLFAALCGVLIRWYKVGL